MEEFNSASVVESADTAPFFHNHIAATLEESIAFYGTEAYSAPDSIGFEFIPVTISSNPEDPEVQAIATFLRLLNTLENIRSPISAVERARRAPVNADSLELINLAREEVKEAVEVLNRGSLRAPTQKFSIQLARARLLLAQSTLESLRTSPSKAASEAKLVDVLELLRLSRDGLVDKRTLPAPFRN